MLSGKVALALNVLLIIISTLKEFVAKFILNVKSSTKTSESANNAMRDMPSATEPAPSSPPELKSTLDASPGMAMETASSAQLDSSQMPMESVHPFQTNAENGINNLVIAHLVTQDMLSIKVNA